MLPTVLSFSATFLPLAILVSPPTIPYSLLHQSFRHSASFSFLRLSVFLGPCFFHSLSSFHSLRRHVSPVSLPVLFLVSQLFVSEPLLSFEQPSPLLRDMIVYGKRKRCFFYESYEDRVSSRLQSADKAKVAEIRVSDISEILPLDIPLRCTLLPSASPRFGHVRLSRRLSAVHPVPSWTASNQNCSGRINESGRLPDEESLRPANPIGSVDNLFASRRSYYEALIANERQIRSALSARVLYRRRLRFLANRISFF